MADKIRQLQKELGTIIKGKKEVTDKIIMAVLARGHVLLEDVPGVGKTTTALALCRLMGMDFNRIQFTPDVVPSDVTGFTMYEKQTGNFIKCIYNTGSISDGCTNAVATAMTPSIETTTRRSPLIRMKIPSTPEKTPPTIRTRSPSRRETIVGSK